jgi:hypothetical protein
MSLLSLTEPIEVIYFFLEYFIIKLFKITQKAYRKKKNAIPEPDKPEILSASSHNKSFSSTPVQKSTFASTRSIGRGAAAALWNTRTAGFGAAEMTTPKTQSNSRDAPKQ